MRLRRGLGSALLFLALSAIGTGRSQGWVDGTTSAGVAGGRFVIRGISGRASHTHGGPPAQLGHVRFVFENHGQQPVRVSVNDIEFLQGARDCDRPPQKVVSHPKSGGILLEDGTQQESAAQVTVAAGVTVFALVGFVAVPAYYIFCDRFAFRVHFQVDKEKIAVVDEVNITRREPLRRP